MARGKKICPKCSTETGVRSSTCEKCKHIFSSPKKIDVAPKEKPEKKEEYVSVRTTELLEHVKNNPYVAAPRMTADEHAKRILEYGKERATNLYKQHKSGNTWNHINWKKIEEGLEI